MKRYYPILLSKKGELNALSNLSLAVRKTTIPIIEVLPDDGKPAKNGKPAKKPHLDLQDHLIKFWTFEDNQVVLDFSLYQPINIAVVRNLINYLLQNGLNAILAIQENSDARYISLVQSFVASNDCKVCIRTSNSSGGFLNYNAKIDTLKNRAGVVDKNVLLLIDLGYAEQNNYNTLAAFAVNTINAIKGMSSYYDLIVASGSFPQDLSSKNLGSITPTGKHFILKRYEWNIWQIIKSDKQLKKFVHYGDYGTKYPYYSEAGFPGTISVKYTVENEFVIYRGVLSKNHSQGNGQYIIHSKNLVSSPDYYGASFSWGDERIDHYANQNLNDPNRKPGSATTWVEISQNHHITLLNHLL